MKTKADVAFEFVNTLSLERQLKDKVAKKGYGDRIQKAARIVLEDGVRPAERAGEYTVDSGSTEGLAYHVNGQCECQDAMNGLKKAKGEEVKSFAPDGWCKHKIAVKFHTKLLAYLKESRERFSLPHLEHRWACTEHRHLPIECWQRICPDPIDIPCPTCTSGVSADPVTGEENPNVPAYLEEVITEEDAPVQDYTIDPEAVAEEENGPVPTITFNPAEEAAADRLKRLSELGVEPTPAPLPEAPVSMCLTLRLPENHQLTYTLRGVTDAEVLERLPNVLATLERLMHTEVDYEGNFIQRLVRAFFPRKTTGYSGK